MLTGAGTGMSTIAMTTWQFPPPRPATMMAGDWNAGYWLTMLLMWWVMMIAMMIPSAAPMILLYARVFRQGQARGQIAGALVPTASFAAGYLVCWLGFSALATALQFALEQVGLVHGMWMWSTSRWLTAALFDRRRAVPAHVAQGRLPAALPGAGRLPVASTGAPVTSARSGSASCTAPTVWAAAGR